MAAKEQHEFSSKAFGAAGVTVELHEETRIKRTFNGAVFEQLNLMSLELEPGLKAKKEAERILRSTRVSNVEEFQFEVGKPNV